MNGALNARLEAGAEVKIGACLGRMISGDLDQCFGHQSPNYISYSEGANPRLLVQSDQTTCHEGVGKE